MKNPHFDAVALLVVAVLPSILFTLQSKVDGTLVWERTGPPTLWYLGNVDGPQCPRLW